ncbi:28094_t:CDS:2 [Gigaspora margarita]|uniref:28094_t:CDS:1 n=1 Tax=Gigaspora margarita TaxID=4874 RepID=A0ABN7VBB8_GIGMA|nr:28094_t:CDS:2 [Gigaspora margarita]
MDPCFRKNRGVLLCFCNKPALPSYTDEFGLIYECGNCGNNDNKVCGFHIHKEIWDKFFDNPSKINPYDRELSICPYFNFTFCVYFRKWNDYQKNHFPPPLCFCERPVILRNTSKNKPMFVCSNYLINGAKPKCIYHVYADNQAFKKSENCIHSVENHMPTSTSPLISDKFVVQVADESFRKDRNILYNRYILEIGKRQSC